MINHKLPEGFSIRELTPEVMQKHLDEWSPKIFDDEGLMLDVRSLLSESERGCLRELSKNTQAHFRLDLGLFCGDEFCGWAIGAQSDYETYYMRNSAILPKFRRRGLYRALLSEVMKRLEAKGFQIAHSRHVATNNAIIIPKLRAGFVISSLEISDRFGTLVHLKYFFNEKRRDAMVFRAGDLRPVGELASALGMKADAFAVK
ncbi:MAG: GNAT family N-acetyltransferase [Bdellovibrionaceae bacterium]|nr:GNAT family N-acetyltransferase [Pseudobdellovibrionaceae bacterium]